MYNVSTLSGEDADSYSHWGGGMDQGDGVEAQYGVDHYLGHYSDEMRRVLSDVSGADKSSVFNLICRATGIGRSDRNEECVDINELWKLVTSAPWVWPYIGEVTRMVREKGIQGLDPQESMSNLEVDIPLGPGYMFSIDLGAYTFYQNNATQSQRVRLYRAMENIVFELSSVYGVSLVQPPAGDCYMGFVPDDPKRLSAFLAELQGRFCKIPMEAECLKGTRYDDGREIYPNDCFQASSTVVRVEKGDLNMSLYTGKRSGNGITNVSGRALADLKRLEKYTSKRGVRVDEKVQRDMESFGVSFDADGEITNLDQVDLSIVAEERSTDFMSIPGNDFETAQVMSVLVSATHRRGALSDVINELRDPGQVSVPEVVASEEGTIGIVCQLGDMFDEAKSESAGAYKSFLKDFMTLLDVNRDFASFQKDENLVFLEERFIDLSNPDEVMGVIDFVRDLRDLFKAHGFPANVAVTWSNELARVPVVESSVVGVSSQEMCLGARIVKGNFKDGKESVVFHGSFCDRAKIKVEQKAEDIRGLGAVPLLRLSAEEGGIQNVEDALMGQELYGIAGYLQQMEDCVADPDVVCVAVVPEKRHVGGYGVSALFKRVEGISIPEVGDDYLNVVRGFLSVLDFEPDPVDMEPDEVELAFNELMADPGKWIPEGTVFKIDVAELDPRGQELFDQLMPVFRERNVTFFHTKELHLMKGDDREVILSELDIKSAANVVLDALDIERDRSMYEHFVNMALRKVRSKVDIPLTPTNLIHVFAPALILEGYRVYFDLDLIEEFSAKSNDLVAEMNEQGLSMQKRFVLGLVASVGLPMTIDNLWMVYLEVMSHEDELEEWEIVVLKQEFHEHIAVLQDRGFLSMEGGRVLLGSKKSSLAGDLVAFDFNSSWISQLVLRYWDRGDFSEKARVNDENLNIAVAELEHLFNIGDPSVNSRIHSLTSQIGAFHQERGNSFAAVRVYQKYLDYIGFEVPSDAPLSDMRLYLAAIGSFEAMDVDYYRSQAAYLRKNVSGGGVLDAGSGGISLELREGY